ncbi:MAG: methyltransferase domain-containing protein [Patescibacteria group bacterium]|nr:methyltransferase domain-containing protein [Patescibacteria group bacterium]
MPGSNFEKNNKLTPEFLEKQINLTPPERNSDFRNYVQKKKDENQALGSFTEKEKSKEKLLKELFDKQIERLGISENDLKNKRILDLVSGDGEFVEYCIKNGITKDVYGLDLYLDECDINKEFENHFFQGSFGDELPVKDADLIVSSGATSLVIKGGEEVLNLENVLENAVESIKDDGEIRMWSIAKPAQGEDLSGLERSFEKWQELMDEISQKQNFKWRLEPRDIRLIGSKNEIVFDYTLVIEKNN